MTPRSTRSIQILLAAVAVLLGANLLAQMSSGTRVAMAQGIPDSGAQLQTQITLLRDIGAKLDKLQAFLEGGKLTVKVQDLPKAEN